MRVVSKSGQEISRRFPLPGPLPWGEDLGAWCIAIELALLVLQLLRSAPAGSAGAGTFRRLVTMDYLRSAAVSSSTSRSTHELQREPEFFDAQVLSTRCGWSRTTQPRSED